MASIKRTTIQLILSLGIFTFSILSHGKDWQIQASEIVNIDPRKALSIISSQEIKSNQYDSETLSLLLRIYLLLNMDKEILNTLSRTQGKEFTPRQWYEVERGYTYKYWRALDFKNALLWNQKNIQTAQDLNDSGLHGMALGFKVAILAVKRDIAAAQAASKETLQLLETIKDQFALSQVYSSLAVPYIYQQDYDYGIRLLEQAIASLDGLPAYQIISVLLFNIAELQSVKPDYHNALITYQKSLSYSLKAQSPSSVASAHFGIGITYTMLGQHEQAISYLIKSMDFSKEQNRLEQWVKACSAAITSAGKTGQFELGENLIKSLEEIDDKVLADSFYNHERYLAEIKKDFYLDRGDLNNALLQADIIIDFNKEKINELKAGAEHQKLQNKVDIQQGEITSLSERLSTANNHITTLSNNFNGLILVFVIAITLITLVAYFIVREFKLRVLDKNGIDSLTRLPNTEAFKELVDSKLVDFLRYDRSFLIAVISFQIPSAGNSSTKEIAKRLVESTRAGDHVAHMGKCIFAILMELEEQDRSKAGIARINEAVSNFYNPEFESSFEPNLKDKSQNYLSNSKMDEQSLKYKTHAIGYTLVKNGDKAPSEIIDRAEQALFIAKGEASSNLEYR